MFLDYSTSLYCEICCGWVEGKSRDLGLKFALPPAYCGILGKSFCLYLGFFSGKVDTVMPPSQSFKIMI